MANETRTMSKTNIVPQRTAVALPFDYGEDAGKGLDLTLDDLLVPFLGLLQKDSKETDESEEKYIEGAAAGMIINKATKQLVDGETGMLLIPALRRRSYVEFLPDRGGFVADHDPNSPIVRAALAKGAKRSELTTDTGNTLSETFSVFAIEVDADMNPIGYVVVPFSSSKIAVWRGYWTKLDTCRVVKDSVPKKLTDVTAIYSHVVRLGSKDQKNDKGKFKNYTLEPAKGGVIDSLIQSTHPAYQAAKALAEAITAGRASADYSTEAPEGGDPAF